MIRSQQNSGVSATIPLLIMPNFSTAITTLLIAARLAQAQDPFAAVRCGGDVPKALIGKMLTNEYVVVTEARHSDIGLKGGGGTIISDSLFFSSWSMCRSEYALLIGPRRVIRAAMSFEHSRTRPAALGGCQIGGRDSPIAVLAILDIPTPLAAGKHYAPNDSTQVPALVAWRIDEAGGQFVNVAANGIRCPRNRIFTLDGGP